MRGFSSISLSIVAAMSATTAHAGESHDVALQALASQALMSELRSQYPEIVKWTIAPLKPDATDSVASDNAPAVKVLQTGARSSVRVSWFDRKSGRQARTVWFAVSGMQSVVVTEHDIAPSELLSMADALIEERDAIGLNCAPLRARSDLAQMRAKRALRAGAAICREAIERRPAVARGEDVTVRYVSDRVSITTKGVAQRDAQIGQKLLVLNPISKDSFWATVSANREVVVHE